MSINVTLPHGASADFEAVTVIRSVDQKESDANNQRITEDLARRPDYSGIIASRRWTLAFDTPNANGKINTRYTSDISVEQLVNAAPELKARFELIDGGRAAVAKTAKVHLIRPLDPREGSDNRAVIHVDGGSSAGLFVTRTLDAIKTELGTRAHHLIRIGDEGFIDRNRIERVNTFDADKPLEPGQQRYAIAVTFKGVYRPQFFKASEAELRGTPVIDLRKIGGAAAINADTGEGRPGARRKGGAVSTPEVR